MVARNYYFVGKVETFKEGEKLDKVVLFSMSCEISCMNEDISLELGNLFEGFG